MKGAIIKRRRAVLRPIVNWCNRNLSQRNLDWIADHSFGWVKMVPRPVRIPGSPYVIAGVKVMDWVRLDEQPEGEPAFGGFGKGGPW
jgi:hypothetical protein